MQIRCTYCQTMFAISREEKLAALEHMDEEKLKYYDAHCPKCRRANRVERFKLEVSYPTWRADLKAMAKTVGSGEGTSAGVKPAAQAPQSVQPKAAAVSVSSPKASPQKGKSPAAKAKAPGAKAKPAALKTSAAKVKTPAAKGKASPSKGKAPAAKAKAPVAVKKAPAAKGKAVPKAKPAVVKKK
jgi:hypothetical protein